mmetsp:Transcript_24975/g.49128  ORF Transcript_24975/g.49128 Transcript_24975/m.49128 type:complete len:394 (+) Transcript_24975:802-1983(+)
MYVRNLQRELSSAQSLLLRQAAAATATHMSAKAAASHSPLIAAAEVASPGAAAAAHTLPPAADASSAVADAAQSSSSSSDRLAPNRLDFSEADSLLPAAATRSVPRGASRGTVTTTAAPAPPPASAHTSTYTSVLASLSTPPKPRFPSSSSPPAVVHTAPRRAAADLTADRVAVRAARPSWSAKRLPGSPPTLPTAADRSPRHHPPPHRASGPPRDDLYRGDTGGQPDRAHTSAEVQYRLLVTSRIRTMFQLATAWVGVRFAAAGDGGTRLKEVLPGSAAAVCGLRVGDLLLTVNNAAITHRSVFKSVVAACRPGDVMQLLLFRTTQGRTMKVALSVGARGFTHTQAMALRRLYDYAAKLETDWSACYSNDFRIDFVQDADALGLKNLRSFLQ